MQDAQWLNNIILFSWATQQIDNAKENVHIFGAYLTATTHNNIWQHNPMQISSEIRPIQFNTAFSV